MRKIIIKKLLIFGFILLPLLVSAEETNLILYDLATEIGIVGKKEYTNKEGKIYKIEFFKSGELKLKGPFNADKLILFETEYRYFNDEGNEILIIKINSDGNIRMMQVIEYNLNQKVRIRWFNKHGRMYQLKELKNGKWATATF